jgi:dCMP deaminase
MENDHCVRTIHAEVNVLIRSTPEQQNGATLYVTDYPCQRCALLISNTGISKVIFVRNYRNNNKSTDLFIKSGIQVSSAESELGKSKED